MDQLLKRTFAAALALMIGLTALPAMAATDLTPLFEAARQELLTPAQEGVASGAYALHTGDSAYLPYISPGVIPYDQQEETPAPAFKGEVRSMDESVVTVSPEGVMTAVAPGETTVVYSAPDGDKTLAVTVADDALPEAVKNYIYVLRREFYEVQRAKLPKYNQYAKWYYGRRKEVGWCSVFTIFCANAAGTQPIDEDEIDAANPPMVQYLREGQVGNQYDGFMSMGRFVGAPKPGYLVIYADMSNEYRTVHIASVTDVEDRGDGIYAVTTIEGNMSNSVKRYCYLYDSNIDNHLVGVEKGLRLRNNMSVLPPEEQTDPLTQYALHTDHWSVFGFCQTWE